VRANASRRLQEGGRATSEGTLSYSAPVMLQGALHRVTIKLNMKFYNASGDLVAAPPIAVSRNHSYAGTRLAALEASVTEKGTDLTFGQTSEKHRKNLRPIVRPTELNEIQFASAEYDRTLFGIVTNEALIKVVLALRDNVGPNFITPWESKTTAAEEGEKPTPTATDGPLKGKIQYVDDENTDKIYVNIGSNMGLAINQEFAVYTSGKPVRDVDTGEVLTYLPKRIGTLAVSEILTGKVSVFRVVEITEPLKIGDVVSEAIPEAPGSETGESQK